MCIESLTVLKDWKKEKKICILVVQTRTANLDFFPNHCILGGSLHNFWLLLFIHNANWHKLALSKKELSTSWKCIKVTEQQYHFRDMTKSPGSLKWVMEMEKSTDSSWDIYSEELYSLLCFCFGFQQLLTQPAYSIIKIWLFCEFMVACPELLKFTSVQCHLLS